MGTGVRQHAHCSVGMLLVKDGASMITRATLQSSDAHTHTHTLANTHNQYIYIIIIIHSLYSRNAVTLLDSSRNKTGSSKYSLIGYFLPPAGM